MALETAPFINGLVASNPPGSDRIHQGDDHIRLIKASLKNTFPNINGAMTLSEEQLNALPGYISPIGLIAIWYGAAEDLPGGWAICNGQTVTRTDGDGDITTPDLRGRVPYGLNTGQTVGQTLGAATVTGLSTNAGGAHGHTGSALSAGEHSHGSGGKTGGTSLSIAQLPAHNHSNGVTDDTGSMFNRGTIAASGGGIDPDGSGSKEGMTSTTGSGEAHDHTISPAGAHSHSITLDAAGSHTHTVPDISVVQPSMALHFIMKH